MVEPALPRAYNAAVDLVDRHVHEGSVRPFAAPSRRTGKIQRFKLR